MQTAMIEGFFRATAMPDSDWWAPLRPNPDGAQWVFGIRPGATVADLCRGGGCFTAPLAGRVQDQARALDIDRAMIE